MYSNCNAEAVVSSIEKEDAVQYKIFNPVTPMYNPIQNLPQTSNTIENT